jgi:hypothetical protein
VRYPLIVPVAILLALTGGALSPAAAAACGDGVGPCRCGDVVVTDTSLAGSDPVLKTRCPCDGLIVAPGVTLVIGGTIEAQAGNQCAGIRFTPGTAGAAVKTGRINGFDIGVDAGGVTGLSISRLLVGNSGTSGILVEGDDNRLESNVVTRSGLFGIDVFGARNEVRLNRTEDAGLSGMTVSGPDSVVSRNLVLRSGFDGLSVFGDRAIVDRNGSRYNGGSGFLLDGLDQGVTLNVSETNGFDGFTVLASDSTFSRNRSKDNGQLGIQDFGDGNSYAHNLCVNNASGRSDPPGLCF